MAYNLQRAGLVLGGFCVRRSIFTTSDHIEVMSAIDVMRETFSAANVPEPELSSKYLLSQTLGDFKADGYKKFAGQHLQPSEIKELNRLVHCRLARMPLQYIAGNWDFRNIQIKVRPPVFIPRPETEQLVDIVLERIPVNKPVSLLEIGPGSGNICLSLLHEREDLTMTAIERSKSAVELTKENGHDLGVLSRLTVIDGRVEDYNAGANEFDAIVSNPPYVLRKDLVQLAPEISLYEDLRALDGGADGLDVVLAIVQLAERVLPADGGGKIFLEIDPCHPHVLPRRLETMQPPTTFKIAETIKDYRGVDRFLVLARAS